VTVQKTTEAWNHSLDARPSRTAEEVEHLWDKAYAPSAIPDRIILTCTETPSDSIYITWRTDSSVDMGWIQLVPDSGVPPQPKNSLSMTAKTVEMRLHENTARYHSVKVGGLDPATAYLYRVGDGSIWSPWNRFLTASSSAEPFGFLYFGDAQNRIRSDFSRVIRNAYARHPESRFFLHAGDLVNFPLKDSEWGEWFEAGSWLFSQVPSLAAAGNHEYDKADLSPYWSAHFTFPDNGPPVEGLTGTCYFVDYQGMRIVILNTMPLSDGLRSAIAKGQTNWLKNVLSETSSSWRVVCHHHPMHRVREGHTGPVALRLLWKRVYEKYGVDLVLQGHDHAYARGTAPSGMARMLGNQGPVYVVSNAGAKNYDVGGPWASVRGRDTQLYQHVRVDGNILIYNAFAADGELFDRFKLIKNDRGQNEMILD